MVGKLLAGIDADIQEMLMNGITGFDFKTPKNVKQIFEELHPNYLVSDLLL